MGSTPITATAQLWCFVRTTFLVESETSFTHSLVKPAIFPGKLVLIKLEHLRVHVYERKLSLRKRSVLPW